MKYNNELLTIQQQIEKILNNAEIENNKNNDTYFEWKALISFCIKRNIPLSVFLSKYEGIDFRKTEIEYILSEKYGESYSFEYGDHYDLLLYDIFTRYENGWDIEKTENYNADNLTMYFGEDKLNVLVRHQVPFAAIIEYSFTHKGVGRSVSFIEYFTDLSYLGEYSMIANIIDNHTKNQTKTSDSFKRLVPKDFILVKTLCRCLSPYHELLAIRAQLEVTDCFFDENSRIIEIPAMYCSTCNKYYIFASTYIEMEKSYNFINCTIIVDKLFYPNTDIFEGGFDELNEQSILRKCGYTVSHNDLLTESKRRSILASMIYNKICSAGKIISHLEWLITMHHEQENWAVAVSKWESDVSFIRELFSDETSSVRVRSIKR